MFPHLTHLVIELVSASGPVLFLGARIPGRPAACCECGTLSQRVHSRYERRLSDTAVAGREVLIRLRVRRLFCDNTGCRRRTFAEQIPELAERHARRTTLLKRTLCSVALALGGRAGARLTAQLAASVSRMTLLRQIRALPDPQRVTPRALGSTISPYAADIITARSSSMSNPTGRSRCCPTAAPTPWRPGYVPIPASRSSAVTVPAPRPKAPRPGHRRQSRSPTAGISGKISATRSNAPPLGTAPPWPPQSALRRHRSSPTLPKFPPPSSRGRLRRSNAWIAPRSAPGSVSPRSGTYSPTGSASAGLGSSWAWRAAPSAASLQREVSVRESHGGEGRIRSARFPARKALEEFDFDHQRSLKRDTITHLGTLDFIGLGRSNYRGPSRQPRSPAATVRCRRRISRDTRRESWLACAGPSRLLAVVAAAAADATGHILMSVGRRFRSLCAAQAGHCTERAMATATTPLSAGISFRTPARCHIPCFYARKPRSNPVMWCKRGGHRMIGHSARR